MHNLEVAKIREYISISSADAMTIAVTKFSANINVHVILPLSLMVCMESSTQHFQPLIVLTVAYPTQVIKLS